MFEFDSPFPLLLQEASPAPAADLSPRPSADLPADTAIGEGQPLGSSGTGTAGSSPPPPSLFGDPLLMFMLIGFMVLMIVFSISSGRKEKKRKEALLSSLAKNQKVQLAGGELGTVVEVRDHEVVVKVDENSNTRIRYVKSAVAAVIE
ncbi:MAG: preprotein translocase subunit YajC [Planctomycetota bacterium]